VIADGTVRTYDMLKLRGGSQAVAQGAATTRQMTDAIIAAL
jgi:3-isopropylmalate dehydrogenase